jgi:hypothetical protein
MMLRSLRPATVLATVMLTSMLAVSSGSAATMRWGAQVFGGYDTHSMNDWNTAIDQANAGGSHFDNIKSGMAFGVGPTVLVDDRWQFGAHYERVMASKSEDQGTEVKPVANAFGVSAGYLFASQSPMNLGLFVSLDDMTLAGSLSNGTTTNKVKGSGFAWALGATSSYTFSSMFSGNLSLGYRGADINVDSIGGVDATGSGLDTENYSGMVARLGFTVQQPRK